MIHRHVTSAFALATVLIGTTASQPTFAQRRAPHAAPAASHNCVRFTREEGAGGRTIHFELDNQCSMPIEGTISWRVVCGEGDGGEPEHHIESLEAGTQRVVVASAESCGAQAYRIDSVHWSWHRSDDAE